MSVQVRTAPDGRNRIQVFELDRGKLREMRFQIVPVEQPADLRPARSLPLELYLVVPERWDADHTYILLASNTDNPAVQVRVARISARAAAAVPNDHARLFTEATTSGELSTMTRSGSCATRVRALWADARMYLPGGLFSLAGAFLFYARVDGREWHPGTSLCDMPPTGRSWRDLGQERFYSICGSTSEQVSSGMAAMAEEQGMGGGEHMVEMIAWLPGTDVTIRAQAKLRLECQ